MLICLDTNIFFQDKWLRGHRFRRLLEYMNRSKSKLTILEPVEIELRALMLKHFVTVVAELNTAKQKAWEAGISVLAPVGDGLTDAVFEHWHRQWWTQLSYHGAVRQPLPDVTREMVRRAAERVPPASPSGRETRDVVVWLCFLELLRAYPTEDACFITLNTSDFALPDKKSLREELRYDVSDHVGAVMYYASLDSFLQDHAQRIAHLTADWVSARVRESEVKDLILPLLPQHLDPVDFAIDDEAAFADAYSLVNLTATLDLLILWNDVSAWPAGGDTIDIMIHVTLHVRSAGECVLRASHARSDTQLPLTQVMPVWSVGTAEVLASSTGESISLLGVENLQLANPDIR